jgi:hypothetical protein
LLKGLTYEKKNLLLLGGSVLLAFLIYSFAIKKTWLVYKNYSEAKSKIEFASNAPIMADQLAKELTAMDLKIGNQNKNGTNTEGAILETLTNYCQENKTVLREFPETSRAEQGNLIIETNKFVIEGNFSQLLNLVYLLEQTAKLGKVTSAHYQLKKDLKSKEMVLTVTIYIQNIKKK